MAKKTQTPAAAKKQDRWRSVIWHALAKLAGKQSDRTLLESGKLHDVHLELRGTVDGNRVTDGDGRDTIVVDGTLAVNHDQTVNSSVAAPQAEVLAYVCAQLPATRRDMLFRDLPKKFQDGEVPELDEELVNRCESLLKQLRSKKPTTRKGSVSFNLT